MTILQAIPLKELDSDIAPLFYRPDNPLACKSRDKLN
jgi:hypothetical protein